MDTNINMKNLSVEELENLKEEIIELTEQDIYSIMRLIKLKKRIKKLRLKRFKSKNIVRIRYRFSPDAGLKTIFLLLEPDLILEILKELLGLKFSEKMKITPLNTEHYHVLGKISKSHVRGDLAFRISGINGKEEITVVIEFQSTKDSTMGFRMFVYSLNLATEKQFKGKKVYEFPKGITIYTTNDITAVEGVDDVYFKIDYFSVEKSANSEKVYSSQKNDLLKVSFPFKNLFQMELDDISKSALYVFSAVYLYKYRKNPELIEDIDVVEIVTKINDCVDKYQGKNKESLEKIASDCYLDFIDLLKGNRTRFKKELGQMNVLSRTPTDFIIEKVRLETEKRVWKEAEKVRLESEKKVKQEAEKVRLEAEKKVKQEAEKVRLEAEKVRLESYQKDVNLVLKMINKNYSNEEILDFSELTLDEIEKIREEHLI